MKVRVRFGIRGTSWLFPNMAVFVLREVPYDRFLQLVEAVTAVKGWLTMNGRDDLANKIVCEQS